jgi:hypothetical protein
MKRITNILFLTATLLMTGCGGHYGLDDSMSEALEGSYIFFDAGVSATKGTLINDTTPLKSEGSSFGVFGFRPANQGGGHIFSTYADNVAEVYWDGNSFSYEKLTLWHIGEHSFYAYYPYNSNIINAAGRDTDNRPYISFVQPTSMDSMVDIMTDAKSASSGEIQFNFQHRLIALGVNFTNQLAQSKEDITLKSASIEIPANTFPASAVFYFNDSDSDGVLDMTASTTKISSAINYLYEVDENASTLSYNESLDLSNGKYLLLLPCASLSLKMKLTIINAWGEEIEVETAGTIPSGATSLKPGYKYFINVSMKADKSIEFTLTETGLPWEENEDIDIGFN